MGAGTLIDTSNRTAVKQPGANRSMDIPLLLALAGLLIFGLIVLFSASYDYSLQVLGMEPSYLFKRQVSFVLAGCVLTYALSRFNYHYFSRLALPIALTTIAALGFVLFMQEIRFGSKRFLFEGSVQPSELAKLVSVIYLAVWLYSKRDVLHEFGRGIFPMSLILGIFGGLIVLQPDLSAAGTVAIIGVMLFFLAGGDLKHIFIMFLFAAIISVIVMQISQTGQQRINDYLLGLKDPTMASDHVLRSFEAIVTGGLFGRGLGQSLTKYTGLPLAPTDSIFAIVVEELGLVGCIVLICLYALLIWRGLVIARRAPDMLGTILASGLVLWIGLEALINMAVMAGLLPFAGNALPFVSSGGSNLAMMLSAVGIVLNISRQQGVVTRTEEDWRSYSAAIDLRWRNRRRSVPRSRRS